MIVESCRHTWQFLEQRQPYCWNFCWWWSNEADVHDGSRNSGGHIAGTFVDDGLIKQMYMMVRGTAAAILLELLVVVLTNILLIYDWIALFPHWVGRQNCLGWSVFLHIMPVYLFYIYHSNKTWLQYGR